MKHRKARVALVYDFDGTLAPGNMQEQSFLPAVGGDPKAFWAEAKERAKQHDMDEILSYMELMLERSKSQNQPITRETFKGYGKRVGYFPGVKDWFDRINAHAKEAGVAPAHFIISSGNLETIQGTSIARHFERIFASCFRYDVNDVAVWPAHAVNYTNKAQFLFRINKGIDNVHDTEAINRWMHNDARELPFERMIFIGDGDTDIPSMKMVTSQGGCAIAVLDPYQWTEPRSLDKVARLIAEDRVSYVAPADYQPQSQLDVIVKGALGRIALRAGLPVNA